MHLKVNPTIDWSNLRKDFPILERRIHGHPLIYLDNAATSQKPKTVIDKMTYYYYHDNANVHRGVHSLSDAATNAYEHARESVRQFINAARIEEIVFVRGTTEAINLVAQSYGRKFVGRDDEIIISTMEHHSNIVPWQLWCEQVGAKLRVVPVTDAGELDMAVYQQLLSPRTKMVAITHVSNVLGTINPVADIIAMAHQHKVPVLLDGAQAVPHMAVDVQALDCDFYVFSGHKMYAPTGIGVLYGKRHWLEQMPPYQGGGSMIDQVSFAKTTYAGLPAKFEAGTPSIADAIGMGAAIEYLTTIGMANIQQHEQYLLDYATAALQNIAGLRIIGTASHKASVISFVVEGIHPHDLATILDHHGIAVRAGHHCAMPLMQRYELPATARVSLGIYNTTAEVDALVVALENAKRLFND